MEKLLSVREAAELLGLKTPTVYKYVCARSLPFVKIGSRTLFQPERLEEWVQKRERPAVVDAGRRRPGAGRRGAA